MRTVVHLLKESTSAGRVAKCGASGKSLVTTAWWRQVTCPECEARMRNRWGP